MPRAKTGGRQKGTPNKSTAAVKEIAAQYTERAWQRLAELIDSEDEKVAMAALKETFDRAYGKAPQAVTGEDGGAIPVNLTLTDSEMARQLLGMIRHAVETE